jgi:hypothetical protein
MITVAVIETGDWADVETPEAAVVAARTLATDARDAAGTWGFDPTVTFTVDGAIVRTTTLRGMSR